MVSFFFFVSQEASPPTHPTKVNLFSANVEVDFGGVGWGGCFSQFGCGSPCSQDFKANRFRNSISKFDFRNSISKFDFEVRFSKFDFRNSILKFDFEIRFSKFDFEIQFRNSRASFFFSFPLCCVLCSLAACAARCVLHLRLHKTPNQKASSTLRSSRAVPHPSTNRALRRLTSEFGRDPVHSTRYGRWRRFNISFSL